MHVIFSEKSCCDIKKLSVEKTQKKMPGLFLHSENIIGKTLAKLFRANHTKYELYLSIKVNSWCKKALSSIETRSVLATPGESVFGFPLRCKKYQKIPVIPPTRIEYFEIPG